MERRGQRFESECDTEVVLKLFASYVPSALQRLNGQFAVAIWDSCKKELFLARDRLGVRPLFYSTPPNSFVFGSEIKAIALYPHVSLSIDPTAMDEVFTGWAILPPRTAFAEVSQLPPGCFARVCGLEVTVQRYWEPEFASSDST